jgi:hypothetical protein
MEDGDAFHASPYKIESLFVNIVFYVIEQMLSFIKGFVYRAPRVSVSSSSASASSVVLGRWGIQYDPKIIRIKIDQANEDHCGCCVSEQNTLRHETTKITENTFDTNLEEEHLLPYVI